MLAILACGACFLPPLPQPRPKAPPYLAGIRTIAIEVEDQSANEPFDSEPMSIAVAANFNQLWKDYHIHAEAWRAGNTADAALHITVIRKSSRLDRVSDDRQLWVFDLTASFAFTGSDGRLLRPSYERDLSIVHWIPIASSPPSLNLHDVFNGTAYNLATSGGGVFFPNPLPPPQEHP